MILKRVNKKGEKYYINAFTGKLVILQKGDPTIKESNPYIASVMKEHLSFGLNPFKSKAKILADQRSSFIGEFKRIIKVNPEKRDKKEFINICKRVNVNPYPLMNYQKLS